MELPRHQCLIYSGDPSRQLVSLATAIHAHVRSNYRCLYLNSPSMIDGIRSYLIASGLNVHDEVIKRRLVLSSDRSYLQNGVFHPQLLIESLEATLRGALDDGYTGLWASGDMAWEFGDSKDFSKLLDYERALEACFAAHPTLRGVCQYHVDMLPKGVAELGKISHAAVYVNDTLSRLNSSYAFG